MDSTPDYLKESKEDFLNPTYEGFEKCKKFYNDPKMSWDEYLEDLEY